MTMDALSDVLRVVRLNSAVFFSAQFSAPWCIASPEAGQVMQSLRPGAERIVIFHLLTEGECRVEVAGSAPHLVQAGEIIVFPHGDAHLMASGADVAPAPSADLPRLLRRGPREMRLGGGGAPTRFICGYLSCDPRLCRPVLNALPRVLKVSLRSHGPADWLETSIQYALAEAASPRPGGAGVLAKLSEVLFIETLRRYMAQLPPEHTGWLAGVRDRVVGQALALMHARPAHPWTVEALASECAISRSVLAERFTHYVGQAPMHYLTRWRMALAADMLQSSSLSITHVAQDVGYETDPAFSRAFRREFGVPPAAWRGARQSDISLRRSTDSGDARGGHPRSWR